MTAQQPFSHQRRWRSAGVCQLGFQTAQGFAQFSEQVFRFRGSSAAHQQHAVGKECTGMGGADKGSRQQLIGYLLLQFLPFFATDRTTFLLLNTYHPFAYRPLDDTTRQYLLLPP